MKRLVVCCDGTWSKPDNETITNVEKIARTVQTDPTAAGGATSSSTTSAESAPGAMQPTGSWVARSGSGCSTT